jgi:hypothetical protein
VKRKRVPPLSVPISKTALINPFLKLGRVQLLLSS